MHQGPEFQIISQCDNGYIGYCPCCEQLNFVYKNVLLTFREEGMYHFCDWLIECKGDPDHTYHLDKGTHYLYSSPLRNMFLFYSESDLQEIEKLYAEARIILEARKLITKK
jgi:hypothetical protein